MRLFFPGAETTSRPVGTPVGPVGRPADASAPGKVVKLDLAQVDAKHTAGVPSATKPYVRSIIL